MPHQATPSPIGEPFIELTSVDSTNNYAMAQAQNGTARHGTTYFAHAQTAGKGQRGKSWTTDEGKNLILSVVLEPDDLDPEQSFLLSATIANGCYDFFKSYAGSETKIKWPNDIYWRDRKTGGILIENVVRKRRCLYSIVGIGININQTNFEGSLVNPTSLKEITGIHFDQVQLARELCSFLEPHYRRLKSHSTKILEDYNLNLYRLNSPVKFRKGNLVFETTIQEVLPSGRLRTYDTMEREFNFGEIEWVL